MGTDRSLCSVDRTGYSNGIEELSFIIESLTFAK
jgi:hypothetical protein